MLRDDLLSSRESGTAAAEIMPDRNREGGNAGFASAGGAPDALCRHFGSVTSPRHWRQTDPSALPCV